MRRPEQTEGFGSDSFLDIVANIVGILIILVMVVGVRAKFTEGAKPAAATPLQEIDLSQERRRLRELEEERLRLESELAAVEESAESRQAKIAAIDEMIERERSRLADTQGQLDARQREAEELRRQVRASEHYLGGLLRDLDNVKPAEKKTVRIESYPTPVSREVSGPEAHFQLLGGRITYVPLEELAGRVKDDARGKLSLLRSSREVEAVVGPVRGFSLRYTLREVAGIPQVIKVTFIPENNQLGETLEEALASHSRMRSVLSRLDPRSGTVTLWTYPDSFEAYRRLKKEIYLLGYSVAGRPRNLGQFITGSPYGSRSAAQ